MNSETKAGAAARPSLLRHLNERAVLEAIRYDAPISRAKISRAVGISKPTVSVALRSLVNAGLVREASETGDGPSYGATFFEPVPDAAMVLGLDLGARFLRGAICDLGGEISARQDVELPDAEVQTALAAVAELKRHLMAAGSVGDASIDGAVVGVPGVVTGDGEVAQAENVHGLEGIRVNDELERLLGVPVTLENDINLAALGEQSRGVARGVDDFVFLSVGTGLGAGVVLHRELHQGHHGAAGEIDFALGSGIERDTDPAAPAISNFARRLVEGDERQSAIGSSFEVPEIFGGARAGDALALEVVEEEARRIALHIAPVAAVIDVELVVIGGGIGANGDLLLAPIRARLDELLPYPPRVEVSSLGDAAVLSGALAVGRAAALDSVFENRARA
ncbi:MAG TPA: ROK family transcriptional regulator [Solirubrobacterales bacterium]|nr:ROK family transcriptional regulator [Solirubrobacterales bacterium]